jgi:hypothetical protein
VGKLNFFRWALEKGILDHIKLHQQDIEKEMNAAMKEQTKAKAPPQAPVNNSTQKVAPAQAPVAQTQTRKRSGRQAAVSKLVQKHDCKIVMEFS